MKNKKFIIILNNKTNEVLITEYNDAIVEDVGDFFEILNEEYDTNFTENNSNYMVSNDELNIKIL